MKKQPEITAATRRKIMDAFWTLYKEKAIEKISIAEITRITGNNRGTFYHYFKDVYAVLEQIEADLLQQVNREVSEAFRNSPYAAGERDLDWLYSVSMPIFKRHEEKIFTLLGKNGDPKFTGVFRESIRAILIEFWNMPDGIEHLDYLMEYAYSAMIGLMANCYQNAHDVTDDEFFRMAQGLVAKGILGYLEWHP